MGRAKAQIKVFAAGSKVKIDWDEQIDQDEDNEDNTVYEVIAHYRTHTPHLPHKLLTMYQVQATNGRNVGCVFEVSQDMVRAL